MAMNTKGMTLRLSNSSLLVTVQSSVISASTFEGNLNFFSNNTAEVDFVALNFSSGMRIQTNSTNNTQIYLLANVVSSRLTIKKFFDIFDDTSTNLSITGYSMEEIGEIVSIDGPSGSVNVIDITNLGSTAREKLVGIEDEGQVSMEVLSNFTTSSTGINQWKLRDLRQTGIKSFFDLIFTDVTKSSVTEPSAYFFEGFVTNYGNAVALDDAVKSAITLEISSKARFISAILGT